MALTVAPITAWTGPDVASAGVLVVAAVLGLVSVGYLQRYWSDAPPGPRRTRGTAALRALVLSWGATVVSRAAWSLADDVVPGWAMALQVGLSVVLVIAFLVALGAARRPDHDDS